MPALKVSHEDFIVAWMTNDSLEDVAKETGLLKQSVTARAAMLRKIGVDLPKFKKPTLDRLRVAQLNSLVNKYRKGGEA